LILRPIKIRTVEGGGMIEDQVSVHSWPQEAAPTEGEIRRLLEAEGLEYYRWSNGPGDVYAAHAHDFHKVLYVVQGSITFGLPEQGKQVELQAGDRLELPAGIVHDARVGPRGVACLEARRDPRPGAAYTIKK
jgi:quercetin dioxygenase-like cupin family protein